MAKLLSSAPIIATTVLLLLLFVNGRCWVVNGFVTTHPSSVDGQQRVYCGRGLSLAMATALTPIGSFCPFRSTTVIESEAGSESVSVSDSEVATATTTTTTKPPAAGFAETFSRIQSQMQLGLTPDPDTLRGVADDMNKAIDRWDDRFETLRSTPDFRDREYATLAETHLESHGTSTGVIALLVRWQSGCLRALADNRPAPVPPPGLDLNRMMEEAKQKALSSSSKDDKTPSITAMQAAERVTAVPFGPDAFESETIRSEYRQLVADHADLVQVGSSYGAFDPSKKLDFLDRIEAIEDRWDSFFARFEPLEESLNQEYVDQCTDYLSCMKLTTDEYRRLLKDAHTRMRQDAERER